MPTIVACILCGAAALFIWGVIGFALGRRIVPAALALPLAPALGWACHSALVLPFYRYVGLTRLTVIAAFAVPLVAAALSLMTRAEGKDQNGDARVPALVYSLAALLAIVPALAVLPKLNGDAVTLAAPIFDHAKIALIEDIARLGVPPGNPFFGEAGHEPDLAYYYLWHFSAAELAVLFGVTGWEADIALAGFTAFASLILMSGFAVWISNRANAGLFAIPLAFAASLHPVLEFLLGPESFYSIFLPPTGFAGWLFQTTWAPQHVAAAACIVLACFLLTRLTQPGSLLLAIVLGFVVAAGYQSSVWIGGILFGLVAPVLALLSLTTCPSSARKRVVLLLGVAAVITVALAFPFVKAQIAAAAERQVAHPIAVSPYEVFNIWIPEDWRVFLNIPGYWLAFLFIEFPAIYFPGLVSLAYSVRDASSAPPAREAIRAFAVLAIMSLTVAGYLTITFADNNDLGWRAVLPGVFRLDHLFRDGIFPLAGDATPDRGRRRACSLRTELAEIDPVVLGERTRVTVRTRQGVWANARDVGGRPPLRRAGWTGCEQPTLSGADDAMARQLVLGALCRPPILLRRARACTRLCAALAHSRGGHRQAVRPRLRWPAGSKRHPRLGASLRMPSHRRDAGGWRVEP